MNFNFQPKCDYCQQVATTFDSEHLCSLHYKIREQKRLARKILSKNEQRRTS